jgi:hypothetical protein
MSLLSLTFRMPANQVTLMQIAMARSRQRRARQPESLLLNIGQCFLTP